MRLKLLFFYKTVLFINGISQQEVNEFALRIKYFIINKKTFARLNNHAFRHRGALCFSIFTSEQRFVFLYPDKNSYGLVA